MSERLIDKDALIDSLGASDRDIYCKEIIEEAPTIDPVKWVPVSERLPNPKDMKNITVLTCRKSTITGRTVVFDIARWNGADWICKGKEMANVTHWMPLPEPPKEDL